MVNATQIGGKEMKLRYEFLNFILSLQLSTFSNTWLLIGYLILQVTTKPVVIYPNSGETYDGVRKEWVVSFLFPLFYFIQILN